MTPAMTWLAVAIAALSATTSGVPCPGCGGEKGEPFTSLQCIVITDNSFTIGDGACQLVGANCIPDDPCPVSGSYTITNNCGGDIYLRTKVNLTCVPGTTTLSSGQSTTITYDEPFPCGQTVRVRIYVNNPGDTCSSTSTAGWTITCYGC